MAPQCPTLWCPVAFLMCPAPPVSPASATRKRENMEGERREVRGFTWGRRGVRTSNPCCNTGESLLLAKADLLDLISNQERGVHTEGNPSKRSEIIRAIDALSVYVEGMVTTGPLLPDTWGMMWMTEKEQLFIIRNARLFGTETGDVLQVIDVENGLLNNVITFPPLGVFFVRSTCEAVPPQRVNFRFTSTVLWGNNWQIPLPPFG